MCGRFTLVSPVEIVARHFGLASTPPLAAHYNIAPSQPVAVVREAGDGRELGFMRWGLVPPGADPRRIGARLINARSETVDTQPAFRAAFRSRRCLMPADGFFEWQRTRGRGQPFYARMRDGGPFAFAALWERSEGPGREPIESCTLLTTEPNAALRDIHDRMPVILDPAAYALWLSDRAQDAPALKALLVPYPAEAMSVRAVSTLVNDPRNDGPECIVPVPFTPRLL